MYLRLRVSLQLETTVDYRNKNTKKESIHMPFVRSTAMARFCTQQVFHYTKEACNLP